MSLDFPLPVGSRNFCFSFCLRRGCAFVVFLAPVPEKEILDFIAQGSIIQGFTVLYACDCAYHLSDSNANRKASLPKVSNVSTSYGQCSQPSGAPVGPGGGTAKSPGRDGTAGRGPSSSFIPTCRETLENDRTGRQNAVRSRP